MGVVFPARSAWPVLGSLAALALTALCGCAKAPQVQAPAEVRFGDRTIALQPYLEGYPYAGFVPLFEAGLLVYDHAGAPRRLRQLPLDPRIPPDPGAGAPVGDLDWNTRTRSGLTWHGPSRSLLYLGDDHDERLNLYRLPLDGQPPVPLTDEPSLSGWSLSPGGGAVAFVAREDDGRSCLRVLPLDGQSAAHTLLCDTPAARFAWSQPSWAPDERGVIVHVHLDGRRDPVAGREPSVDARFPASDPVAGRDPSVDARFPASRRNLAWVSFAQPAMHLLLDPVAQRREARALSPWLDPHRVVLTDDAPGAPRIGVLDLRTGDVAWTIPLDQPLSALALLEPGKRPVLLGVLHRPDGDTLVTWDPETGEQLAARPVDGTVSILGDDQHSRALIQWTSPRAPFEMAWLDLGDDGALTLTPWMSLPDEVAHRVVQCEVEAVTVPTPDRDPATGEPRQLHAFLYTPRRPLQPAAARITAFDGGSNRFDPESQVLCEAGIATLSPAVRGSGGFGPDFQRLNNGDLGGDELADLFHAARFLEERGYPRGRIGVSGASHATLRALTFPPGTHGHSEVYPFAFGISHAGLSDLLTSPARTPDGLLEAGDPHTEAEKHRERSPLHHVDALRAPLLLIHGEHDHQVPVEQSRQVAEACQAAGKPCTTLELPGQGHRGREHELRAWRARFAFLEGVLLAGE